MKIYLRAIMFFFLLISVCSSYSQDYSHTEVNGILIDSISKQPLLYASVFVPGTTIGIITNENGHYSLNISKLPTIDSVRFQYMGYQTKDVALSQLLSSPNVSLAENIINLKQATVFGNTIDPVSVIEKVSQNLNENYQDITIEREVFIRQRFTSDIQDLLIDYKKSTISEIDKNMIVAAQENIPRNSVSYTDFYGKMYVPDLQNDSIPFKLSPMRVISLKEKELTELDNINTVFENTLKATDSLEYWKIKTGIIGTKVHFDFEDTSSVTLPKDEQLVSSFTSDVNYQLQNASFSEKEWDFIFKPSRYKFSLFAGSNFNNEDIYIIDFVPKQKGIFQGRLFVSMESFAILRVDYQYAPQKRGNHFNMFGISYTDAKYEASVHFEKVDTCYQLKYFSLKTLQKISFDRKISLLKKRKRPFFDKTMDELKTDLDISLNNEESFEFLVLSQRPISKKKYTEVQEEKSMKVIYIDQFRNDLWEGYNIIEPTQQMREYTKQFED